MADMVAALVLQVSVSMSGAAAVSQDSTHRIPVTAEHLRTAFADSRARTLLMHARAARLAQDSSLVGYDATAYQRISAGLGFRRIGRDRLVFRTELASRVRWQRGVGAWVDVRGARTALPIVETVSTGAEGETREALSDALSDGVSPIPYYPGRDELLPMLNNGIVTRSVNDREIVHPLAEGAEAYYTYAVGDALGMRLPEGRVIRLVELRVRPRRPQWNLTVASLWFDESTARLARAVFRLAEPMDIVRIAEDEDPHAFDDVPIWVKPMIMPMRASVSAISVEYGLYEGRWWLPRAQLVEGDAQVSFMHVPFKLEQRFRYSSVNGRDSLPAIVVDSAARRREEAALHDRPPGDSAARARRRAVRDSLESAQRTRRERECRETGAYTQVTTRYNGALPIAVRVPCDTVALARSSELPASIYDPGEEVFGTAELRALTDEALRFGAQAAFIPQRPRLASGLQYVRYNRVEALSVGGAVEQALGAGYTARLIGRLGVGDWQPNAELSLARSDGRRTVGLGVYRRLAAANDWGEPLSFGNSLNALLFGRDEGFYYRTWGAELSGEGTAGPFLRWRLFAEEQWSARPQTNFSLAHLINGLEFRDNIAASRGRVVGAAVRINSSRGLDPHGWRLLSDLRGEGGAGSWVYGRGAVDLTVSHGLGRHLDGSLTTGAGTSLGDVPVQRLWYLGGAETVRGQVAGTAAGDSYWMTRGEVGASIVAVRPVVFADVGWAGERGAWRHPGRPLSGVGVGASFLDGLFRFDVAKGLYPSRDIRANLYLEARF